MNVIEILGKTKLTISLGSGQYRGSDLTSTTGTATIKLSLTDQMRLIYSINQSDAY